MTTAALPVRIQNVIEEIRRDPTLNEGVRAMRARKQEFPDPMMAKLAGIAMVPAAREILEGAMDEQFAPVAIPSYVPELIVGGGLHAAAYATARHQSGLGRPWVLEQDRVGGTFAMTRNPGFYLNSRNRPGPASLPGDMQGLNVLPAAPLQPSCLANSEFQPNTDFAFCIRLALAASAHTVSGVKVNSIEADGEQFKVITSVGALRAGRVIEARGLGVPRGESDSDQIITFPDLMRRMDTQKFPLRGLRKVAVIGAGDSAKCAIEALTGQGPCVHMSVNNLDYVDRIDWYGPELPTVCPAAAREFRSRYRRLSSLLPVESGAPSRVRVFEQRAFAAPGFRCAYVNDRPYDAVIVCVGYMPDEPPSMPEDDQIRSYRGPGASSDRLRLAFRNGERYFVGAQRPLAFERQEARNVRALNQNVIAAFRTVPRTYTLAAALPAAPPEAKAIKFKAKVKVTEVQDGKRIDPALLTTGPLDAQAMRKLAKRTPVQDLALEPGTRILIEGSRAVMTVLAQYDDGSVSTTRPNRFSGEAIKMALKAETVVKAIG